MKPKWLALIESNTTGTGRLFARAALKQGFRPVLLSSDPSRYGYASEDWLTVREVDCSNRSRLLSVCNELASGAGLAGVTSSSEYFIATAAGLAESLGLPGPDADAILQCRDKLQQRLRLQAAGLAAPIFRSADNVDEALEAAAATGLPAVIKPVTGSGSAGVRLCRTLDEVASHASLLFGQQQNERGLPVPGRILIEEFIDGPEFSIETFNRRVIGITRKYLGEPPYFVECGHDYPAELPTQTEEAIYDAVQRAFDALGLGWGPAHFELRAAERGPTIIEVNPRLAGGYIPELVRLASGIDLISEAIRLVSGQRTHLSSTGARYSSIRFILAASDGELQAVEGLSLAKEIAGVTDIQIYTGPRSLVRRRGDFRDRVGHVIAVSRAAATAREAASRAHDSIRLVVT